MSKLILPVANKSSWHPALGAWILLTTAGIPFRERVESGDRIVHGPLLRGSEQLAGMPILYHGSKAIWGALGIMEYLAELFPEKNLWPKALWARTVARAVAHEIHSKVELTSTAMAKGAAGSKTAPETERLILKDKARFEHIVSDCRSQFGKGGKFLFGKFTIADAVLAPIVLLFESRFVALQSETRIYMDAVLATDAMASWREGVLAGSLKPRSSDSVHHAAV